MFNEEGSILSLINSINQSLKSISFELILVNDGSDDRTVEIASSLISGNQKIVVLDRNYGQSTAIKAGLDLSNSNIIAILDADGQNSPEDIIPMLQVLAENNVDLVQGIRDQRTDSLVKLIPSKVANSLMRILLGIEILDSGCALKVFDKSILNGFPFFNGYHRLFSVIAQKRGVKIAQMKVKHHPRIAGESNYGIERTPTILKHMWMLNQNPDTLAQKLNYSIKEIIHKEV
ncbi:MAG: glycosyltransferase family 2 protein [Flavobacteriales bacterium]|nr:glycosyltransferase family 2 protein [Flavobacteriales bacterium]